MRRSALFAYGFRPFFLIAGVYAVLVVPLWLWIYARGEAPFAHRRGDLLELAVVQTREQRDPLEDVCRGPGHGGVIHRVTVREKSAG